MQVRCSAPSRLSVDVWATNPACSAGQTDRWITLRHGYKVRNTFWGEILGSIWDMLNPGGLRYIRRSRRRWDPGERRERPGCTDLPSVCPRKPELPIKNQPSYRLPAAWHDSWKGASPTSSGLCKSTRGLQQWLARSWARGPRQEASFSKDSAGGKSQPDQRALRMAPPSCWIPQSDNTFQSVRERTFLGSGRPAGHSCLVKRKLGLAPWAACFSSGFFSHGLTTTQIPLGRPFPSVCVQLGQMAGGAEAGDPGLPEGLAKHPQALTPASLCLEAPAP